MGGFMPVMSLEGELSGGDYSSVVSALTSSISASTVATILATSISSCAAIVLLYFGARKAIRMFMGALNRGKIKL